MEFTIPPESREIRLQGTNNYEVTLDPAIRYVMVTRRYLTRTFKCAEQAFYGRIRSGDFKRKLMFPNQT